MYIGLRTATLSYHNLSLYRQIVGSHTQLRLTNKAARLFASPSSTSSVTPSNVLVVVGSAMEYVYYGCNPKCMGQKSVMHCCRSWSTPHSVWCWRKLTPDTLTLRGIRRWNSPFERSWRSSVITWVGKRRQHQLSSLWSRQVVLLITVVVHALSGLELLLVIEEELVEVEKGVDYEAIVHNRWVWVG